MNVPAARRPSEERICRAPVRFGGVAALSRADRNKESHIAGALAGGALALTCGALLVSVLRSGSIRVRGGGRLRRKDHPAAFWIHVAALFGFCALGGGMILWALIDPARFH